MDHGWMQQASNGKSRIGGSTNKVDDLSRLYAGASLSLSLGSMLSLLCDRGIRRQLDDLAPGVVVPRR
jgi:hypothetical protein